MQQQGALTAMLFIPHHHIARGSGKPADDMQLYPGSAYFALKKASVPAYI